MPDAGEYSYLKHPVGARPASLTHHERWIRPVAALATVVAGLAAAVLLWLAPWPVDALAALAAAVSWTSWLDRQEPT